MTPHWSLLSLVLLMASGCCFSGGTTDVPTPPVLDTPPVLGTTPAVPAPGAIGGTISLAPGFMPDPWMSTGAAGGPIAASTMNSDCRGYITAEPSAVLNATGAFTNLRILASSSADTTLVVQRADGTFL